MTLGEPEIMKRGTKSIIYFYQQFLCRDARKESWIWALPLMCLNKSLSHCRAWFFPSVNGRSRETGFVLRVLLAMMVS